MRFNTSKSVLTKAGLAACVLLLASGASFAQQQINLTASGTLTAPLPDGSAVPMWGYTCGAAATGSTATCAALNPAIKSTTTGVWSPVVITIPYTESAPGVSSTALTVNLTNGLLFANGNSVPTSLVIIGQLGGGLGTTATSTPSPAHATQGVTWSIPNAGPTNVPPPQGNRVQSFSTEVAIGTTTALTWSGLKPGTYLIESGTHPSIQGPMGLYGMLVVTTAPAGTTPGTAYPAAGASPAVTYTAEIPLLMSEIDPVQNNAVNAAVNAVAFSESLVWSGQPGGCGNPAYVPSVATPACYPPAVNYTPLYYLINGVAFDKTNAAGSVFSTAPAATTGSVLVRLVNAGLRMHVPSIVGAMTTPLVNAGGAVGAATPGFSLIAEDGNRLPGVSRVQSEVFMPAGKTNDVMVNVPTGTTALPVFDRELSLSANSIGRDGGMLAYIATNGQAAPAASSLGGATARADTYNSLVAGQPFAVSDPSLGVIANDTNVIGVTLLATPTNGTVTLNANGTFSYLPSGTATSDSFTYCANGSVTAGVCSSGISATVTLAAATIDGNVTCTNSGFTSNVATTLSIKPPGILAGCKDAAGHPLTVNAASVTSTGFSSLSVDANGGFNATVPGAGTYSFSFKAQNSQGTVAGTAATVQLTFLPATGLTVNVVDGGDKTTPVTDYRWIIEEDRTFYINPNCTTNPPATGCPTFGGINGITNVGLVPTFGTNFHTSYMPVVAAGCTGPVSCEGGQAIAGANVVCDVGNGICRPDATGNGQAQLLPSQVHLDPTKRYYISVLPGDAANSFENANSCLSNPTPSCGHGMGGAPIMCVPAVNSVVCTATSGAFPPNVTVLVQPNPFPPSKLSVFVFEDDFPLNGEQDGGGGIDVLSPNEPGLGGFNITLFDDAGGTGDATGQMTYDMFNMPLSNGLAGTKDPNTGLDACPISGANQNVGWDGTASPTGITGTIVTCPKFEADGKTLSPLAGQVVVSNLMPGRYGVVATPGADRIARGEEWLQTNTLDGQKAHDSFLRIGEPSFFQEYGPAGYHVSIGFANPAIINARKAYVCNGTDANSPQPGVPYTCNNTVTGTVTTERMSRTPDERLYSSGDNSSFSFTQCYVSFGDADGEDFAFTKCDSNGNFTLSGLPEGDWRITVFDQWNDMLVDGLSTPVRLAGGATVNLGQLAINQWQANIYTTTFFDTNGNGVRDANEQGLALVATNNRFRDGSYSNFNNTDLFGNAGFNEIFPLFSWYVIETDTTRYKSTGTHVVYDAGGPSDGSPCGGTTGTVCGNSNIAHFLANTAEQIPVPTALRVPGAFYCATADCTDAPAPLAPGGAGGSTGRVDPPFWFGTEGWQGFSGQNQFIEFGKKPYAVGETGGIHGEVIYASTRPFDDPTLLIHTSWTPDVPGVTVNLYKEGVAADGITPTLTLIDTTKTSSWDDWAQGFRSDGNPNMNCPGQGRDTGTNADIFFFSLYDQPEWLDLYNNGGVPAHPLPNNAQFKCYDGMHNWNQVQPAPYDGMYSFPSVTSLDPKTGRPTGTNCTACGTNPDTTDPYRSGTPMLLPGKYVVEMIVPPGYELVKEEDKNILIGDNYIAPATQEFAGLGNVFILPDQAEISALYNANNAQNPTQTLGRTTLPNAEGDTGSVERFWPCVGAARVVPDYISLFPQSTQISPFAGATRNLCDRKEITLTDQSAALAKFWIFSSTHVAAHFTGVITDDFTSEFDPFSPQFGEKFSPP
ncbi:MAG TPA: Ig-like domain-containing protein, partial [Vicinamibacterales bacterium]|nr:Ig-like domain-containing protein [Vicinamibacterales bacterium]